jgi:hypothetical protein
MERNMGTLDRVIRGVIVAPAAVWAALALGAGTPGGIALLVVAAVMLVTALAGFCPLYRVLRISTCPARR